MQYETNGGGERREGGLVFKNLVSSMILGKAEPPRPQMDCITTVYSANDCDATPGEKKELRDSVTYMIVGDEGQPIPFTPGSILLKAESLVKLYDDVRWGGKTIIQENNY